MYRLATLTALTLTFFLTTLPAFAQVARFELLGSLAGPAGGVFAWGVSADGSTVVGSTSTNDGGEWVPFRWKDGEMEGLPRIPGSESFPNDGVAASADGSIVLGKSTGGGGVALWENGETRVLNDPELCPYPRLRLSDAISHDGSIVVGDCEGEGEREASRWVEGEWEGLGWLTESPSYSSAQAISGDGSTVVGFSRTELGPGASSSAFRWTEESGMEDLCPEQDWCSYATAVNPDASVIVGDNGLYFIPELLVGWRWEEGVGVQQLTRPEGWEAGPFVKDVSADGSIIVGTALKEVPEGCCLERAFIWTEDAGLRDLFDVLEEDFDLDVSDFQATNTWGLGISDDGTVIVGHTVNPENAGAPIAWRVEAPFHTIADEATPEALADVLSAPSPNPVSGTSTFTVAVEHGQHVAVEVFDALGRHVQTVYDGALAAGMSETLTLDASALPAGVYIVRATGEDFAKTQRVTVVR